MARMSTGFIWLRWTLLNRVIGIGVRYGGRNFFTSLATISDLKRDIAPWSQMTDLKPTKERAFRYSTVWAISPAQTSPLVFPYPDGSLAVMCINWQHSGRKEIALPRRFSDWTHSEARNPTKYRTAFPAQINSHEMGSEYRCSSRPHYSQILTRSTLQVSCSVTLPRLCKRLSADAE
jgi:hypothetical protein